jgi:hypothetical protein
MAINNNRYKIVDEDHPRFNQVGIYDRRWLIPTSNPELHCHTITFEDGATEQFLAYQIEKVNE